MKKQILFLAIFLPIFLLAHEDSFYEFSLENVKVRISTGHYYEEIENVKIIGEYASILCETIGYKEPVLLDFIHDYGHNYQGEVYSFIDYGSGSYDLVSFYIPQFDSVFNAEVYYPVDYQDSATMTHEEIEKDVYTIAATDISDILIVRQFGFSFEIESTLNLLYYALLNEPKVKTEVVPDTLQSYDANMYYVHNSIPGDIVESESQNTSRIVNKTLENKVYSTQKDSISPSTLYYSYFSKNNKYYIFAGIHNKQLILDSVSHIFSFSYTRHANKHLFVFETPQKMKVYHEDLPQNIFVSSELHIVPIDNFEYLTSIFVEYLGDDIYFVNYLQSRFVRFPFKRYIYLSNDDVLITDFESYIDSYRLDKN